MTFIKKITTSEDIADNSKNVLAELKETIDGLPLKKAEVLLYWLDTWKRYLVREDEFNYKSLPKYSRGAIIQVHLGFKVGSEQGGLHYALVVENDNAPGNGTVMAIPIRSLRSGESVTGIHKDEIFLGFDLFEKEIDSLSGKLRTLKEVPSAKQNHKLIRELSKKLADYSKGSVAIVNQMCAVSKLRIYTPRSAVDELSRVKLSHEKLDEIDVKVIQRFTKSAQRKVLTKST